MAHDRDEKTGKFTQAYPPEDFIQAVEGLGTATTAKVAKEVGCSYDLAYRRLNELSDSGAVERVEVGNSFIWNRA